jgi:hypothetical protein
MPYLRGTRSFCWWAELKTLGRQCTARPSEILPTQSASQRPPLSCAHGPDFLARQTKKTYGTKQHVPSLFRPRSSRMPSQCMRELSTTTSQQVRCQIPSLLLEPCNRVVSAEQKVTSILGTIGLKTHTATTTLQEPPKEEFIEGQGITTAWEPEYYAENVVPPNYRYVSKKCCLCVKTCTYKGKHLLFGCRDSPQFLWNESMLLYLWICSHSQKGFENCVEPRSLQQK